MSVEYRNFIDRGMLFREPKNLFVFGDNLERRGFGGQAKEMRGQANAVGIPTKRKPTMEPGAFLYDHDVVEWFEECQPDFKRLLLHRGTIIIPKQGIGTGRARLKENSPLIHKLLRVFLKGL